jgi:hypothetical protein
MEKRGKMGRPKGSLNKATVARQDLLDAWTRCASAKTADKLVLDAVAKALGYDVTQRVYEYEPDPKDHTKRVRVLVREKVRREYNYAPLEALLPYMAQKLPSKSELTGADGKPLMPPNGPISVNFPPIDFSSPLWTPALLEKFIEATRISGAAKPG